MKYKPEDYYSQIQKTVVYVVRSLNQDVTSALLNQISFEGGERLPNHALKAGFLSHFISWDIQNENSVIHQIYENGKDELVFRVYLNYFNALSYTLKWNWKKPLKVAALLGLSEDVFLVCKTKKDFSLEEMCSALLLLSMIEEGDVSVFTSSGEMCIYLKALVKKSC